MPDSPERTALYRYFNADDELLYIGISIDPDGRLKAHRASHAPWVGKAARRTIEWHDSRALALKAEEIAVKSERPIYNEKHNYNDAAFNPASWSNAAPGRKIEAVAELMRSEILDGRWMHGQRIPSLRTLGAACGASSSVVSKASVILQNEGLLDFQSGHGLFVTHPPKARTKLPHDYFWRLGFPG